MFRKMIRTKAPSTKQSTFPLNRWPKGHFRLKARSQASLLALACIAFAGPAVAASAYDGNWSVVIATTGGACDPTLRYPVAITNGMVGNAGDSAGDGARTGHPKRRRQGERAVRKRMGQRLGPSRHEPRQRRLERSRLGRRLRRHLGGDAAAGRLRRAIGRADLRLRPATGRPSTAESESCGGRL